MLKEELTQKNTNETTNKKVDNLDELKTILFGKEKTDISDQVSKIQTKLETIETIELFKKHFNDPTVVKLLNLQISDYLKENSKKETITKSVSKALPEAITRQLETKTGQLSDSLAPVIGKALQKQIKTEKTKIVDALYPIIGSTISKYMTESLQELMENINEKVEEKMSFSGISRKIKSKFSGVSEAELLFQNSIQSKIKSIFLIHKKTGVSIADAHDMPLEQDDQVMMVSGMFSAINSFVNDWIQKNGEQKEVDSIDYGDSKILFESSGSLIAAVVVKNGYKKNLKTSIRNFLELLHLNYTDFIDTFDGDVENIPLNLKSELNTLLKVKDSPKKNSTDKASFFTFKKTALLLASLIGLFFITKSSVNHYKTRNLVNKISTTISTDPFLKNLKLSVDTLDDKKLIVIGIIPNSNYLNRLQKIVSSVDNSIIVNKQNLVLLNTKPLEKKLPIDIQNSLASLTTNSKLYRSLGFMFSNDGILTIRGFSVNKINIELKSVNDFFTKVNNQTKSLDFFTNRILNFKSGELSLSSKNRQNIDEISKYLIDKNRNIKTLNIFYFEDNSSLRSQQKTITDKRKENITEAISALLPSVDLKYQSPKFNPIDNISLSELKSNLSFIILPKISEVSLNDN